MLQLASPTCSTGSRPSSLRASPPPTPTTRHTTASAAGTSSAPAYSSKRYESRSTNQKSVGRYRSISRPCAKRSNLLTHDNRQRLRLPQLVQDQRRTHLLLGRMRRIKRG